MLLCHGRPGCLYGTDRFYGYPVLTLFCLFYLHRFGSQVLKNFAYLSAVLLLIISINLNLNFAKTHFFGFSAENKLLERLTARIQSHQDFPAQASTPSFRPEKSPCVPVTICRLQTKIRLLYAAGAIYPLLDCL